MRASMLFNAAVPSDEPHLRTGLAILFLNCIWITAIKGTGLKVIDTCDDEVSEKVGDATCPDPDQAVVETFVDLAERQSGERFDPNAIDNALAAMTSDEKNHLFDYLRTGKLENFIVRISNKTLSPVTIIQSLTNRTGRKQCCLRTLVEDEEMAVCCDPADLLTDPYEEDGQEIRNRAMAVVFIILFVAALAIGFPLLFYFGWTKCQCCHRQPRPMIPVYEAPLPARP